MPDLGQPYRDAAYPAETGEPFPILLTIEHEKLAEPIRLTNVVGTWNEAEGWYEWSAQGKTWVFAAFDIQEPEMSDEEPRGRLSVPNVDQIIGETIDLIDSPATVSAQVVLYSDPDVIVRGPYEGFILQNISVDPLVATGDLNYPALADRPYPRDWIRPSKYRAAFRAVS